MNNKMNFINEIAAGSQHPDRRAEVSALLRSALTPKPLKEQLLSYHEHDIAAAMELLSRKERDRLYSIWTPDHWPAFSNTPAG